MDSPGPWFLSKKDPRIIVNLYHNSGVGSSVSHEPLRSHGAYAVLKCFHPATALEVVRFPEFVRTLSLVADNPSIMQAIRNVDPVVATLVQRTMDRLGTRDTDPRTYQMMNRTREQPFDPSNVILFKEKLSERGLKIMFDMLTNFHENHPWNPHQHLW